MSLTLRANLLVDPSLSGIRKSGWRATCEFEGVESSDGAKQFGCEVTLLGRPLVVAGDSTEAILRLWVRDYMNPRVNPGHRFRIMEGHTNAATGVVIEAN